MPDSRVQGVRAEVRALRIPRDGTFPMHLLQGQDRRKRRSEYEGGSVSTAPCQYCRESAKIYDTLCPGCMARFSAKTGGTVTRIISDKERAQTVNTAKIESAVDEAWERNR